MLNVNKTKIFTSVNRAYYIIKPSTFAADVHTPDLVVIDPSAFKPVRFKRWHV